MNSHEEEKVEEVKKVVWMIFRHLNDSFTVDARYWSSDAGGTLEKIQCQNVRFRR